METSQTSKLETSARAHADTARPVAKKALAKVNEEGC